MSRDTAKQGLAEIAQVKSFDAEYPKLWKRFVRT
jgi:hypothetical protein